MRIHPVTLTFALLTVSAAAQQQLAKPTAPANISPKVDLVLGYDHTFANAPPGVSNDFGLNGGYAGAAFHFKPWLAAAVQATGGRGTNISALGQNLTLITYTAGPRVLYPHGRIVLFGQALFGGAHASDSYFPNGTTYTTSANSFAYALGGGMDVNLTRHVAVRPLDVQFLHTAFNNGSSNVQRHLLVGAGIVFKFGGKEPVAPAPPAVAFATPPRGAIHLTCSTGTPQVNAGDRVEIVANATTEPGDRAVLYTWMPEAGVIEGTGSAVRLNTTSVSPGRFVLRGHAALVGDDSVAADCEVPIVIASAPPAAAASSEAIDTPRQKEFHTNVPDAYFDYDSAAMRPDARAATAHASDFLNQHPDMRVLVEGFADERGSTDYNLTLGRQRAEAARNALIAAGVDSSRVEIVSFGKANAVCAEAKESCYRQNRRAAFSLHP